MRTVCDNVTFLSGREELLGGFEAGQKKKVKKGLDKPYAGMLQYRHEELWGRPETEAGAVANESIPTS